MTKRRILLAVVFCLVGGLAIAALPDVRVWFDGFDTYAPGPLTPQSQWTIWYSGGLDATVVPAPAPFFSPPHSLFIVAASDVTYDFNNTPPGGRPNTGRWIFSVKTYVSRYETGMGWVILMNQYMPTDGVDNWSMQVSFDATTGLVTFMDFVGNPTLPLIYDQWVTFRAAVDLDNDRMDLFYGDQVLIAGKSWINGVSGGGVPVIAIVDLYGQDTTGMWMDDCSLYQDTAAAALTEADNRAVVLDALPNPAPAGANLAMTTMAPQLAGQAYALFTWSVNGAPFIRPVWFGNLDATGRAQIAGPVPPGLGGINVEFISFVALPPGGIGDSPPELVMF
ncbi:MAG: hypothetical protein AB1486_06355 [Planctomycetota bacterium]